MRSLFYFFWPTQRGIKGSGAMSRQSEKMAKREKCVKSSRLRKTICSQTIKIVFFSFFTLKADHLGYFSSEFLFDAREPFGISTFENILQSFLLPVTHFLFYRNVDYEL